jgi:hypothetical protein
MDPIKYEKLKKENEKLKKENEKLKLYIEELKLIHYDSVDEYFQE